METGHMNMSFFIFKEEKAFKSMEKRI